MNGIGLLDPPMSGAPNQIQPSITGAYQPGGLLTPGYYGNLAYRLAGSPTYGPYPTIAPPPAPAGGYGIPSGTSSGGGTAGGVLGTVAGTLLKNPQLVKTAYNAITGLFGPSVDQYVAGLNPAQSVSSVLGSVAPIAVPTASEIAAGINAPASGNLYAGADGASTGDIGDTGSVQTYNTPENMDAYSASAPGSSPFVAGSSLRTAAGYGGNLLGIYSGLQQGGTAGDAQAAINAAQLSSRAGLLGSASGAIGSAAGYAAAPLAVYNAIHNYQSGATGSDALSGAAAGASIGSVVPVVGTALGAVIGGAVGGIASAFGPGKEDPENITWNNYAQTFKQDPAAVNQATPSQSYQSLAGIFDSRGSQIPFYSQYGRMGEGKFLQGMTDQINSALSNGTISATDSAQTIYNKVVDPWVTTMGGSNGWQNTYTVKGAPEKAAVQNLLTNMVGQYINGQQGQWTGVDGSVPKVASFGGSSAPYQPSTVPGILYPIGAGRSTARVLQR
jgi:hypothetical protein